ncbi:hypothetical protein CRUP_005510, partial [Coryphaenoides rupestris]
MLCFGQSAFFRFNHPAEALRMKSMSAMTASRPQPADFSNVPNGHGFPVPGNGDHPGLGSVTDMDRPPQDPLGFSDYDCPSPSALGGPPPPPTTRLPTASTSTSVVKPAPVPRPRISPPAASSSNGSVDGWLRGAVESPCTLRGSRTDVSDVGSASSGPGPTPAAREQRPTPRGSPAAPSRPRVPGPALPRSRGASPMREQGQLRPQHREDVAPHPQQKQRTPEGPGGSGQRELPPHGSHMSRSGTAGFPHGSSSASSSSSSLHSHPGAACRAASQSPRCGQRKILAQTGSGMVREQTRGGHHPRTHSGSSPSPLTSPGSQRKAPHPGGTARPRGRERKNSISEISDNEDELLEYHRWQRDERLREQEMEKQERQRLESILSLCAEYNTGARDDLPADLGEAMRAAHFPRACEDLLVELGRGGPAGHTQEQHPLPGEERSHLLGCLRLQQLDEATQREKDK